MGIMMMLGLGLLALLAVAGVAIGLILSMKSR